MASMRHAEYLKRCLVLSGTVYCKCQICSKSPDLIFPPPIPQLLSWFRKCIILSLHQKWLYVYLLTTHLFSQRFIFLGNFALSYSLCIENYTYLKNRATFTLRKPNPRSRNKTLQGPTPHSKLPSSCLLVLFLTRLVTILTLISIELFGLFSYFI